MSGHWTEQYGLGGVVTRESMDRAINEVRAQNAELQAALKLIARQTAPRHNMPDVAVAICSAINSIAETALAKAKPNG